MALGNDVSEVPLIFWDWKEMANCDCIKCLDTANHQRVVSNGQLSGQTLATCSFKISKQQGLIEAFLTALASEENEERGPSSAPIFWNKSNYKRGLDEDDQDTAGSQVQTRRTHWTVADNDPAKAANTAKAFKTRRDRNAKACDAYTKKKCYSKSKSILY